MELEEDIFTVEEVAHRLKVSPKTIYRYCNNGKLDFIRVGGNIRIEREALLKLIREGE